MTNLKLERPLAVIDLETTGLNKQEDRIVDICIIKIMPDGQEETLKYLLNPTIPIPSESTEVHKITDGDVKDEPKFSEIAKEVTGFLEGCDICGFGVKFDMDILASELARVGISYSFQNKQVVDVQSIYFKLEPRDLSAAYSRYCKKELNGAHGAECDVRATIDVLEAQLEQHDDLPKDVPSLEKFGSFKKPMWVDNEGRFMWKDGKAIINFGKKHPGKTLEEVAQSDPDFLNWVLTGTNFSSDAKNIIKEALEGKFPQQEQEKK